MFDFADMTTEGFSMAPLSLTAVSLEMIETAGRANQVWGRTVYYDIVLLLCPSDVEHTGL